MQMVNEVTSESCWKKAFPCLMLTLVWGVAIFFYYPTLFTGFMWDDWGDLGNVRLFTFTEWLKTFEPMSGVWRSMAYLTWWLQYRLFEHNHLYFHITHLITHLINSGLVFLLTLRLTSRPSSALLAALFFCWNEALISPVAWNSAAIDQKLVLFGVPAMLFYLQGTRKNENHWGYLSLFYVFYYLALKSKLMGVTFPALFVLYELIFRPPAGTKSEWLGFAKRIAKVHWPLWVLFTLYCIGHFTHYGDLPREGEYGVTLTIPHYLKTAAWYLHQATLEWPGAKFWGLVVSLAIVILGWRFRSPTMIFGCLWFFLTIAPVAILTKHHYEHHLYLPLVGLALALGNLFGLVIERLSFRNWPLERVALPVFMVAYFFAVQGSFKTYAGQAKQGWAKSQTTLKSLKTLIPDLPSHQVRFLVHPRPDFALFDYQQSIAMLYSRFDDIQVQVFDASEAFAEARMKAKEAPEGEKPQPTTVYVLAYLRDTGELELLDKETR